MRIDSRSLRELHRSRIISLVFRENFNRSPSQKEISALEKSIKDIDDIDGITKEIVQFHSYIQANDLISASPKFWHAKLDLYSENFLDECINQFCDDADHAFIDFVYLVYIGKLCDMQTLYYMADQLMMGAIGRPQLLDRLICSADGEKRRLAYSNLGCNSQIMFARIVLNGALDQFGWKNADYS